MCIKEYSNNFKYCVECGNTPENNNDPPREKPLEHIKYAFKVAGNNTKVFLPIIAYFLGFAVFVIVMVLILGLGYDWTENPSYPKMNPFSMGFSAISITLLALFVISIIYIALISTPFLQHLYYRATIGEEVKFRNSLKYANSRILSYLGAYLVGVIIIIPVSFAGVSNIPPEELMSYDEFSNELLWSTGWPILLIIPFGVFYVTALYIMTWDNIGLVDSIKASYSFIRHNFAKLFIIMVIFLVVWGILYVLPYGFLVSYFIGIIANIAIIDVYIQYKKKRTSTFNYTQDEYFD